MSNFTLIEGVIITLTENRGEARVDSRLIAQALDRPHASIQKLLTTYAADFQAHGILRFEIGEINGRGQPEKFARLNEDQSYLLLTYMRNTPRTRPMKGALIKAFAEARRAAELRAEYLPTYHALHDQLHLLASGSENERWAHANLNKLVNRTAGIEPGQRPRADVPHKAMLIAAQHLAAQAMQGAADHHEGYARAKRALEPLAAVPIGRQ